MNREKQFASAVGELENMVSELEKEASLHKYCVENSLDYRNHSHYAVAAVAVINEKGNPDARATKPISNLVAGQERYGKRVADSKIACYNKFDAAEQLTSLERKLDELSEYGLWNDLERGFKTGVKKAKSAVGSARKWLGDEWNVTKENVKLRKDRLDNLIHRRVIINKTNSIIGVTGGDNRKTVYAQLRPGESSSSKNIYDADGVVILKGQKFRCNGIAYDSGVIKVWGNAGMGNAEVYESKTTPNEFYVNAMFTEHHTLQWAKGEKWQLPW